jgi:hypothetical protein
MKTDALSILWRPTRHGVSRSVVVRPRSICVFLALASLGGVSSTLAAEPDPSNVAACRIGFLQIAAAVAVSEQDPCVLGPGGLQIPAWLRMASSDPVRSAGPRQIAQREECQRPWNDDTADIRNEGNSSIGNFVKHVVGAFHSFKPVQWYNRNVKNREISGYRIKVKQTGDTDGVLCTVSRKF